MTDGMFVVLAECAMDVHKMCRRCGSLIAMGPATGTEDMIETAHIEFHNTIDRIAQLAERNEKA